MAAIVCTLRCYRAVYDSAGDVTLGVQVGDAFVATVPNAGVLQICEATFIDTVRPQAGMYVITGQTDAGSVDATGIDVYVLAVGA